MKGRKPAPRQKEPGEAVDFPLELPNPPVGIFKGHPAARAKWAELAGALQKMGTLAFVEHGFLAGICLQWAIAQESLAECDKEGYTVPTAQGVKNNPAWSRYLNCMQVYNRGITELALTPTSAAKVSAADHEEDELAALLKTAANG